MYLTLDVQYFIFSSRTRAWFGELWHLRVKYNRICIGIISDKAFRMRHGCVVYNTFTLTSISTVTNPFCLTCTGRTAPADFCNKLEHCNYFLVIGGDSDTLWFCETGQNIIAIMQPLGEKQEMTTKVGWTTLSTSSRLVEQGCDSKLLSSSCPTFKLMPSTQKPCLRPEPNLSQPCLLKSYTRPRLLKAEPKPGLSGRAWPAHR